jgi:hypothetical protein
MKLRDVFISEEQLATDSLIREVIEERWINESHGERAALKSSQAKREFTKSSRPEQEPDDERDDFGDEPDDFGSKSVATSFGGEEAPDEFVGAPADPALADFGEDTESGSEFDGEPVFGDVPEPIVDPEDPLWHGGAGWEDETGSSGPERRSSVSFPDYEGPKHRNGSDLGGGPDEKGFYPRASAPVKKSRR